MEKSIRVGARPAIFVGGSSSKALIKRHWVNDQFPGPENCTSASVPPLLLLSCRHYTEVSNYRFGSCTVIFIYEAF